MALTDPLGDMLTRIRNGQRAKKDSVVRSIFSDWLPSVEEAQKLDEILSSRPL